MTQLLFVRDGEFVLKSDYNASLVMDCRNIPGRTWEKEDKTNRFPLVSKDQVVALANKWDIPISPEIVGMGVPAETLETHYGLEITDSGLEIRFDYDAGTVLATKSMVIDSKWDRKNLVWKAPLSSLDGAIAFCARFGFSVAPEVAEIAQEAIEHNSAMVAASSALTSEIDVQSAIELYPFQLAGIDYLMKTRFALLADSPGLGKSAQALCAAVEAKNLPIVVICPKTLKLNWELQVGLFHPELTVTIVNGGKPAKIEPADVVVCNYDIASGRAQDLIDIGARTLIGDEAHALRNSVANHFCPQEGCKTKVRVNSRNCPTCRAHYDKPLERWSVKKGDGFMRVANSIPDDGMVLLLSGTPVVNRPSELVPLLAAMRRLGDFGGIHRFNQRYTTDSGKGSQNELELAERLRSICMVRREKKDVLTELPALMESKQMLDIDPTKMAVYAKIESDVVEHIANRAAELAELAGEDGKAAYWEKRIRAEAAEHLVRISVLKNAASDVKYDAVVEWIEEWLDESEDEKILLFAEHIEMVEKLSAHFGDVLSCKVRGNVSQTNRAKAVEQFQNDPKCRIFIGNFMAASEGITLTAAKACAFLEYPWSPTVLRQCADRGYGRLSDQHGMTAYYLIAPRTLDVDLVSLLMAKRNVIDAITDGRHPSQQAGSILGDVIVALAHRGGM